MGAALFATGGAASLRSLCGSPIWRGRDTANETDPVCAIRFAPGWSPG